MKSNVSINYLLRTVIGLQKPISWYNDIMNHGEGLVGWEGGKEKKESERVRLCSVSFPLLADGFQDLSKVEFQSSLCV